MSQSPATGTGKRARPLSPHIGIYRWSPTMLMSILHRFTGGALYFGTLLVAWWLVAAATSPQQFDLARSVLGSWFGLLVLFGYSWALIHHMVGGVRHLVWDTGAGLEKHTATRAAQLSLAASVVLTILVWAAVYAVGRG